MALFTKVIGWTISITALVRSNGLTKRYSKGNTLMARNMVEVVSFGLTEAFLRVISSITRWKDMEFTSGSMDAATTGSGRTTSSTGMVCSLGRTAEFTKEITLRTSGRANVSSLGKFYFVISNLF